MSEGVSVRKRRQRARELGFGLGVLVGWEGLPDDVVSAWAEGVWRRHALLQGEVSDGDAAVWSERLRRQGYGTVKR